MRPAEDRQLPRLDARLDRVALLLRQAPGFDSGVDAILECLLERGVELARLDVELPGGVVDDRLGLLLRRAELCRRDGTARRRHGDGCSGAGDELAFEASGHRIYSFQVACEGRAWPTVGSSSGGISRPSCIRRTRPARVAAAGSWVMRTFFFPDTANTE